MNEPLSSIPTTIEAFKKKRAALQRSLEDVNAVISQLEANPDLQKAIEAVLKVADRKM
jgi:hypothetical protein